MTYLESVALFENARVEGRLGEGTGQLCWPRVKISARKEIQLTPLVGFKDLWGTGSPPANIPTFEMKCPNRKLDLRTPSWSRGPCLFPRKRKLGFSALAKFFEIFECVESEDTVLQIVLAYLPILYRLRLLTSRMEQCSTNISIRHVLPNVACLLAAFTEVTGSSPEAMTFKLWWSHYHPLCFVAKPSRTA